MATFASAADAKQTDASLRQYYFQLRQEQLQQQEQRRQQYHFAMLHSLQPHFDEQLHRKALLCDVPTMLTSHGLEAWFKRWNVPCEDMTPLGLAAFAADRRHFVVTFASQEAASFVLSACAADPSLTKNSDGSRFTVWSLQAFADESRSRAGLVQFQQRQPLHVHDEDYDQAESRGLAKEEFKQLSEEPAAATEGLAEFKLDRSERDRSAPDVLFSGASLAAASGLSESNSSLFPEEVRAPMRHVSAKSLPASGDSKRSVSSKNRVAADTGAGFGLQAAALVDNVENDDNDSHAGPEELSGSDLDEGNHEVEEDDQDENELEAVPDKESHAAVVLHASALMLGCWSGATVYAGDLQGSLVASVGNVIDSDNTGKTTAAFSSKGSHKQHKADQAAGQAKHRDAKQIDFVESKNQGDSKVGATPAMRKAKGKIGKNQREFVRYATVQKAARVTFSFAKRRLVVELRIRAADAPSSAPAALSGSGIPSADGTESSDSGSSLVAETVPVVEGFLCYRFGQIEECRVINLLPRLKHNGGAALKYLALTLRRQPKLGAGPFEKDLDDRRWKRALDSTLLGADASLELAHTHLLQFDARDMETMDKALMELGKSFHMGPYRQPSHPQNTAHLNVRTVAITLSRALQDAWNIFHHRFGPPDRFLVLRSWLEALFAAGTLVKTNGLEALLGCLPKPDSLTPAELQCWYRACERLLRSDARHTGGELAGRLLVKCFEEEKAKPATKPQLVAKDEQHMVTVFRALRTPSQIIALPPTREKSNHAVRKFRCAPSMLRVQFCDEDLGSLKGLQNADALFNNIKHVLAKGLDLFGCTGYQYLGSSLSQMRASSVWMVRPFTFSEGKTQNQPFCASKMADRLVPEKKDIRNAAKLNSCIGLGLTTSRYVATLNLGDIGYMDDIVRMNAGGDTFCFSEGIGLIDSTFLTELKGDHVSAIQIRLGGFKGVLARAPAGRLEGRLSPDDRKSQIAPRKIVLRLSMRKFVTRDLTLNIVSVNSTVAPAFLNRQSIMLLTTLGIQPGHFVTLQHQMLKELGDFRNGKGFPSFISGQATNHYFVKAMQEFARQDTTALTSEPFLKSIVAAIAAHWVKELRQQARLFVPKSTRAMGVLDETNSLGPGEVYCSNAPSNTRVVVWKEPCLHPGDIRVLRTVDCKALHYLPNVLVFPQQGSRPLTNEMSGSDLDGDTYFISWDPELTKLNNDKAAAYPAAKSFETKTSEEDRIKHFVDNVKNDLLGVISNAHLGYADLHPKQGHARSPLCLQLAALASQAVDYPKTNVLPVYQDSVAAVRFHPEYMEFSSNLVRSKMVLGTLFRTVKKIDKPLRVPTGDIVVDRDLTTGGWKQHAKQAAGLKQLYDQALRGIMAKFGFETEAEYINNARGELQRLVDSFAAEFGGPSHRGETKDLHGAASASEDDDSLRSRDLHAKACAWYMVTYDKQQFKEPQRGKKQRHLLSFAWIPFKQLSALKNRGGWPELKQPASSGCRVGSQAGPKESAGAAAGAASAGSGAGQYFVQPKHRWPKSKKDQPLLVL